MFPGRATHLVLGFPLGSDVMLNYNSGDIRSHPTTSKQSHLSEVNISSDPDSIPDNLNTATSETTFNYNSAYRCSCKKSYSHFSDPYAWRRPEEPDDCSRGDIKRACRLGMWY